MKDYVYDAFISYSHASDDRFQAKRLQVALEQFAKGWFQRRAIRIFRDTSSLSASSDLWRSVTDSLGCSRYMILLASVNAAKSQWVSREVEWWRQNRDPQ